MNKSGMAPINTFFYNFFQYSSIHFFISVRISLSSIVKYLSPGGGSLAQWVTMDERELGFWKESYTSGVQCATIEEVREKSEELKLSRTRPRDISLSLWK